MSVPGTAKRSLASLAIVTGVALIFALLLLLVRLQWPPLESVDHHTAAWLNSLIAIHPLAVSLVKAVTWLGSGGGLWTLTGAAAAVLAIRRRWRLAIYLLVAGSGALVLDPVLKALVGRLRPVVAHPIAATMLIKPNKDGLDRSGRRPLGLPHRKADGVERETAPASG